LLRGGVAGAGIVSWQFGQAPSTEVLWIIIHLDLEVRSGELFKLIKCGNVKGFLVWGGSVLSMFALQNGPRVRVVIGKFYEFPARAISVPEGISD